MSEAEGPPHITIYDCGLNPAEVDSTATTAAATPIDSSLLHGLSLLKDKVNQVESLVGLLDQASLQAAATMVPVVQEIIATATSMMFTCQQLNLISPSAPGNPCRSTNHHQMLYRELGPSHDNNLDYWYGTDSYVNSGSVTSITNPNNLVQPEIQENSKNYDNIVELHAADLLAKYTHYCHVCGKGFIRDANLRMHMRAHGDKYKSAAALSNPTKNNNNLNDSSNNVTSSQYRNNSKKYSCPEEGCKWNKKHPKFTPLKSMICAKNHYKRSHCPKMYVCNRCNTKQFSVLSDLRTHEKHCGDLKWQCSCGNTFSRKDKLLGHVNLFVGHAPMVDPKLQ